MAQYVPLRAPSGPQRRSTRVDQVIPLTVMGADAWRGPYHEKVSTITVSCHGCKYESKYEVIQEARVILEVPPMENEKAPRSVRGHVKWIQRPSDFGQPFQVAVELDVPGNVWGIALPPEDWFVFPDPGPKGVLSSTEIPTVSTLAPALVVSTTREEPQKRPRSREAEATGPQPQPISRLVSDFHEQFERTVSEAAKVAVSDGTNQLLDELRAQLREDASKTLAELASANSDQWFRGALERIDGAHQALAEAAHKQWTKKIEQDLEKAGSLLDKRLADLNQMAQTLVTAAQEKHQRALEASWRDLLARFVSQLQEKVNPVLQSAQQGLTNLTKCREDSEKKIQQAVVESGNRMHELSEQLVAQFEQASRDRLATLVGDFERNCAAVVTDSLGRFNTDFGAREEQAKQKLESVLPQALELMSRRMQEKATDISRRFAGELDNYCRSQFEYISGVIGELAKGFGEHSKT